MSQQDLEIEVKFLISGVDPWRPRLLAAGMRPAKPRLFERNVIFDTAADDLARRRQLLRLRQDDGARLTLKQEPESRGTFSDQVRVRQELEVSVGDFDTLARILGYLGLHPRQTYEKHRETFHGAGVEAVLDELPFGHFLELEGGPAEIRAAADGLGLAWERRILDNYLDLMARLRQQHDLPFADLTFANFAALDVSIADVLGPAHS